MKIKLFFLFVLLILAPGQAQKINGLSFVASRDSVYENNLNPVLAVHANAVALMPFGFIPNLNSPEVRYSEKFQWFGERVEGIHQYAKAFKQKGIKLMLKPQIWVSRGQYTGHIEMRDEQQWKTLEFAYARFILDFAKVANEIDAEIFCIGTELEKFVLSRPDFWKNLIAKIRGIYKGKLTYAANWDEFKRVDFWGLLDYIGIDAYFPLTNFESPSVSDFEKGWINHKEEIEKVKDHFKKPVLFTEFGYRSINYTGKEPWDAKRVEGNVNLKAQSNGLQAIYNQFWRESWFAGGFVWKWFMRHDKSGGQQNNRFTPQNKPAEKLLSQLYQR